MQWMADCIFAIRDRGSVCKITMTTRNSIPTNPWQSFFFFGGSGTVAAADEVAVKLFNSGI